MEKRVGDIGDKLKNKGVSRYPLRKGEQKKR